MFSYIISYHFHNNSKIGDLLVRSVEPTSNERNGTIFIEFVDLVDKNVSSR